MIDLIRMRRVGRIQTVNLQHLHEASVSLKTLNNFRHAEHVVADGWPVAALSSAILGRRVKRITGRDIVHALVDDELTGHRVALCGSSQTVSDEFEKSLSGHGNTLAYADAGFYNTEHSRKVIGELLTHDVDLVLVALGAPKGEILAAQIAMALPKLGVVQVGGAVEMECGHRPGAPGWVGSIGLEWLFRLVREPRRFARRYIVDCLPLVPRVLALTTARVLSRGVTLS